MRPIHEQLRIYDSYIATRSKLKSEGITDTYIEKRIKIMENQFKRNGVAFEKCPLCQERHLTVKVEEGSFVRNEIYLNHADTLVVCSTQDNCNPAYREINISVEFCPMCGRKLKE